MIEELETALALLARDRSTTTYGALATKLELTGSGRIAQLTSALEGLMEQDTDNGQPLRAALVTGRASNGLPARGFFDKARALGHRVDDPAAFHQRQIAALFDSAP